MPKLVKKNRNRTLTKRLAAVLVLGLAIACSAWLMLGLPSSVPFSLLKENLGIGNSPFALNTLHERLDEQALAKVGRYIDLFKSKHRRVIADGLSRSSRYIDHFYYIFEQLNIPNELAYLPLIESSYVSSAISHANAVGVWQFTAPTATRFELSRDEWHDERRDPLVSAWAAGRYLKHLHQRFDSWELALAAYNAGAGTVNWAMRNNQRKGLPQDFWSLDTLPDETRAYVPAFLASVIIFRNHRAYGFGDVKFQEPLNFEEVRISPGVSFESLAHYLEIDESKIAKLNPSFYRNYLPESSTPYLLRMPIGTREKIEKLLSDADIQSRDWLIHHIQPTETLNSLATKFNAPVADIERINQLRDDTALPKRLVVIPL